MKTHFGNWTFKPFVALKPNYPVCPTKLFQNHFFHSLIQDIDRSLRCTVGTFFFYINYYQSLNCTSCSLYHRQCFSSSSCFLVMLFQNVMPLWYFTSGSAVSAEFCTCILQRQSQAVHTGCPTQNCIAMLPHSNWKRLDAPLTSNMQLKYPV